MVFVIIGTIIVYSLIQIYSMILEIIMWKHVYQYSFL